LAAEIVRHAFGRCCKARGACCGGSIVKCGRLARTAHRRIEVDFSETRLDIGRHHGFSFDHGLFGLKVAPRVWAKMVATQQDLFCRTVFLVCNSGNKSGEGSGSHSGVTALMVYLIGGCLNQD
jgi:hypothetical protein